MKEENVEPVPSTERHPRRSLAAGAVSAFVLALAYGATFRLSSGGSYVREAILFVTLALLGGLTLTIRRFGFEWGGALWRAIPYVSAIWIAGESGRLVFSNLGSGSTRQWLVCGAFALAAYGLLMFAALRELAGSSALAWAMGTLDTALSA